MSKVITVYQAKTHLSQLIDDASQGKEVRIGKYGKPMVKLVPDSTKPKKRVLGRLSGKGYWIADDFNDTPPEVIAALEQTLEEDLT